MNSEENDEDGSRSDATFQAEEEHIIKPRHGLETELLWKKTGYLALENVANAPAEIQEQLTPPADISTEPAANPQSERPEEPHLLVRHRDGILCRIPLPAEITLNLQGVSAETSCVMRERVEEIEATSVSVKPSAQASTKPPAQASTKPPAEASAKSPARASAKSTARASVKPLAETSAKPSPQASAKSPARASAQPRAQASINSRAQASTKPPAQASAKSPAQASAKPRAQASINSRAQASTKPPAQASAKSPAQASTKPPAQASTSNQEPAAKVNREELPEKLLQLNAQLCDMRLGNDPWTYWPAMQQLRNEFFTVLQDSLLRKMKFVQESNIENQFWRDHCCTILRRIRDQMKLTDIDGQRYLSQFLLHFILDSYDWFMQLLNEIQKHYSFKLEEYTGKNAASYTSGMKHGLALVSAQKLCLFLGDLTRYQLEWVAVFDDGPDSQTEALHSLAKRWYEFARDIIPKNAKPYNQLALLACNDRKFFESVYLSVRCSMASNPFASAWNGLLDLFRHARVKYEATRADDETVLLRMLKENSLDDGHPELDRTVRREIWIHPADQSCMDRHLPMTPHAASERMRMQNKLVTSLPPVKLEHQFYNSFVHLIGMIATKTGMEGFSTCADQVLREFQQLLEIILKPNTRLLEISALLMYAMDKTKRFAEDGAGGGREQSSPPTELQQRVLSVIQPFIGLIVERILRIARKGIKDWWLLSGMVEVLGEQHFEAAGVESFKDQSRVQTRLSKKIAVHHRALKAARQQQVMGKMPLVVTAPYGGPDGMQAANVPISNAPLLLPAVKIWCDWLQKNETLWNTPVGAGDYNLLNWYSYNPFDRLAELMDELSKINTNWLCPSPKQKEGYFLARLPEDIHMAGFLPLEGTATKIYLPVSIESDMDPENGARAVHVLRIHKILQFGQWLCERKPPVLQLVYSPNKHHECVMMQPVACGIRDGVQVGTLRDYEIDTVEEARSAMKKPDDTVLQKEQHQRLRKEQDSTSVEWPSETSQLASRMQELTLKKVIQEKYHQRRQELLQPGPIQVVLEVRPKFLVADTNCFVDDLRWIKAIVKATHLFTLMVPIVVVAELRGLSMGAKKRPEKVPTLLMPASASRPGIIEPQAIDSNPTEKSQQHLKTVTHNAAIAVKYLQSVTGTVQFATTKGSILRNSVFTTEEDEDGQKTNDDRILETVLNLMSAGPSSTSSSGQQPPAGEPRTICRDVVLLTSDRNLRVKAIAHNVPVRDMYDFAQWARLQLPTNK